MKEGLGKLESLAGGDTLASATARGTAYWLSMGSAIGLAAVAQLALLDHGLYRMSADESARSLMAAGLSWENALQPWIWPPFYKVFVGLLLKAYPDIFWVPRAAVFAFGLLTMGALVFLSRSLFANRVVDIITAILSIFICHRLLLSVVPMSDIFFFLFSILSAAFVIRWLRRDTGHDLIAASLALFLASTVRYEACFFSLLLGLYLGYRYFVEKTLRFALVLGAGVLLALFPVSWTALSYYHYGSTDNLAWTRQQFLDLFGPKYSYALRKNMLAYFVVDVGTNPVLAFGIAGLAIFSRRNSRSLVWTGVWFLSLPLAAAAAVASLSLTAASPWRLSGVWTLLLLPFTAYGLILAVSRGLEPPRRMLALAGITAVAVLLFLARDVFLLHGCCDPSSRRYAGDSVQAGRAVARLLGPGDYALVDSVDNYEYLDVLAASNAPDRILTTALADPVEVANWMMGRRRYYRENRTEIVDRYLRDKFTLATVPDTDTMARAHIKYVLVRNQMFIASLDRHPHFSRRDRFNRWVLYERW
jgi:hypothetical protein